LALKKCKECEKEVSTKADKCPNCGAPIKAKEIGCFFSLFIIGAVIFVIAQLNSGPTTGSKSKLKESEESKIHRTMDKSPEKQAKREELLQDLINEGVFYKVEKSGDYPYVYVNTKFYFLSIDEKKSFVNVAFTYFFAQNIKNNFLIVKDSKTGKNIGTFSLLMGLDLD
jgi:hypothetical protein